MKIRRLLRRLGCGVLLVLWFAVLTLPCFAVALVFQKEIVLTHSDIPNDEFRIWLIQDIRNRGVAVTNSRRVYAPNGVVCTVINGGFFMWQGTAANAPHYCSCYSRQDQTWSSVAEGPEACRIAGEPLSATPTPTPVQTAQATVSP